MYRFLSKEQRERLVMLRKQGKSIPEISKETGTSITTVQRHIKGVQIPREFQIRLRERQGGSKDRAKGLCLNIEADVKRLLARVSRRDYLFLLVGLYWGEGTKKDFSVINSDPLLIQTLIYCLKILKIPTSRLSLSLRVHTEVSVPEAKKFWARTTGLPERRIERIEVIEGKKKGKLPYGMCRVRVRSGIRDRLFIQTAIALIGKECSKGILSQ